MGRLSLFYLSVFDFMVSVCAVGTEVDASGILDTGKAEV